jgi:ribosome-binding protein aMBF1 (putative translation factor)
MLWSVPKDLVSEVMAKRGKKNPRFSTLVVEAEERRAIGRALAACRERLGMSQTVVAGKMRTSASVVSKLEAGGDVKVSTLQRYCNAIGKTFPSSPEKWARLGGER